VSLRPKILITAGPTREKLDPVRFISNLSTGEAGYSIARAFQRKKYRVTLVSGPTCLKPPAGVRYVPILSVKDLQKVLLELFPSHDVLVMSAAVCDFTPRRYSSRKLKRSEGLSLRLARTPDLVAALAKRKGKKIVVGFCLETSRWIERAKEKLIQKRLDGIVANYYGKGHVPFGRRRVTMALIGGDLCVHKLNGKTKPQIASAVVKWVEGMREMRDPGSRLRERVVSRRS
jgi:phosphopantothenoylcysteine decarboxylase/phosphopantothenate--cysteine ligase